MVNPSTILIILIAEGSLLTPGNCSTPSFDNLNQRKGDVRSNATLNKCQCSGTGQDAVNDL